MLKHKRIFYKANRMLRAKNLIKNYWPYLCLLLLIVLPWFYKPGYIFFTDVSWGPHMRVPDFASSGNFYLFFIIKALSFIIPVSLLQKIFITAILVLTFWGGHKIAKAFTNNRVIIFLAAAFALFSPFVYDRLLYGQLGIILSYGFFLGFFGYLLSYYFNDGRKQLLLSAVFGGLAILFSAHFTFFVGLMYLIVGFLILLKKKPGFNAFWRLSGHIILIFLLIILLNFNWIYGVFRGGDNLAALTEQAITEHDLEVFRTRGQNDIEVAQNIFLMSGFWGMEQFRYESLKKIKENWGRGFYVLLPIIVFGIVAFWREKEKRKFTIAMLLTYLAAFVLAAGIAINITAPISLFLFRHFPFYKAMREPQKWVVILVAIYEVFLVYSLVQLAKKKIVIVNRELAAFMVFFFIVLQSPLLFWGAAGQIRPVEYPSDWYEVNEFIKLSSYRVESKKNKKCESKILFLPWHAYMGFGWAGRIIATPAAKFFECPVFSGTNMEFGGIYSQTRDENSKKIEIWLFSRGQINLLGDNDLDINYVILAKEVDWENYDWLNQQPYLQLVKETNSLKIYQFNP